MEITDDKPKRRVRYQGTHPKSYQEKYKELQPEKYQETVAKVIQKGNTPAGMHRSIAVEEILEVLAIKPGEIGLDATLGYGGHTLAMLSCLNHQGHIHGIDVDPIELPKTKERLEKLGYDDSILSVHALNFADINTLTASTGLFDFILADLGVSSMQIDNPDRGFSFKIDGPLDLRLNPEQGVPAAYRLQGMSEEEIKRVLTNFADEPHADRIARAIITEKQKGIRILTTTQLRNVIKGALQFLPKKDRDTEIKKSCQRTFQALRIEVNHELEALDQLLNKLPDSLAPGGRVAILSFHSGEDRLVKRWFQYYLRNGVYQKISEEFIRPSLAEQSANSRAKSAKLRWAIKK